MGCMRKTIVWWWVWWWLVLIAAAIALLIAWADRAVHVPASTLLATGAVVLALSWLVMLVTVPWNLYFAARRAARGMAVSRERGISVRPASDAEAGRIARWMLRFAVGAHLGTAIAAAAIGYGTRDKTGYYIAGIFLLSTVFRPAAAYFRHVRERITALTRESTHPRDDVLTLRSAIDQLRQSGAALEVKLTQNADAIQRTGATLTDTIAHNRDLLVTDLRRLQDTQQEDRRLASAADEALGRRIDQMVRRIEATLSGISDHRDLLAGLQALVRMVRES
jgi:hypothetical protein